MILDRFVPSGADAKEVHSRFVAAPTQEVCAAARELRVSELSPIVGVLMVIRALPALLLRRGKPGKPSAAPRGGAEPAMLARLADQGFVILADSPEEIVFGLMARPWQLLDPEPAPLACPEDFLAFDDPTMARIACNITVREVPGGTLLATETRVSVGDPRARKAFRRYWLAIRLGSGLIRRLWLRAIAKRVERQRADGRAVAATPVERARGGAS